MLSFEGSCIAALALYGALSLLVKLFGAAGMAKSLLGQKRVMADKPEKQEPLLRERESLLLLLQVLLRRALLAGRVVLRTLQPPSGRR